MMAVALPTICAENPTAGIESDSLELLSDVCSSDIELSVGSSQLSIGSVDSGMDISDSGTDDELSLPSNSESDTESSTGSEREDSTDMAEDSPQDDQCVFNTPLYERAKLTVFDSFVLLLQFSLRLVPMNSLLCLIE